MEQDLQDARSRVLSWQLFVDRLSTEVGRAPLAITGQVALRSPALDIGAAKPRLGLRVRAQRLPFPAVRVPSVGRG
jgi:hypothetical protein